MNAPGTGSALKLGRILAREDNAASAGRPSIARGAQELRAVEEELFARCIRPALRARGDRELAEDLANADPRQVALAALGALERMGRRLELAEATHARQASTITTLENLASLLDVHKLAAEQLAAQLYRARRGRCTACDRAHPVSRHCVGCLCEKCNPQLHARLPR